MRIIGTTEKIINIKQHYQMWTTVWDSGIIISANVFYQPKGKYLYIKGSLKSVL